MATATLTAGAKVRIREPWMNAAADDANDNFDRMMAEPKFREAMLNMLDKSAATDKWYSHEDVWNELERGLCGETI